MTRINLVPPAELCDQHLIAEYRELPRVFALARTAPDAPSRYTLGTGHVKFFYDKLQWLFNRQRDLCYECEQRGFKISYDGASLASWRKMKRTLWNDWSPTKADIAVSRARINERLETMEPRHAAYV